MQTLGVSVKQLRRKLLELGARILHVQGSKPRDMALVVCVSKIIHKSFPLTIDAPSSSSKIERSSCILLHGATVQRLLKMSYRRGKCF